MPLPPPIARIVLVHGFNVSDGGAATVGRLEPFFRHAGFDVNRFRYGWRGLLGVKFLNETLAQLLADLSEQGDILVAHSNGCLIAQRAAELGGEFQQLVYINPALDRKTPCPTQVDRLHVWHSPGDRPVAVARWIPFTRWGDMGAVGYQGAPDLRVKNYNKQVGYAIPSITHSDIFTGPRLSFFAPLIVDAVTAALKPQPTAA